MWNHPPQYMTIYMPMTIQCNEDTRESQNFQNPATLHDVNCATSRTRAVKLALGCATSWTGWISMRLCQPWTASVSSARRHFLTRTGKRHVLLPTTWISSRHSCNPECGLLRYDLLKSRFVKDQESPKDKELSAWPAISRNDENVVTLCL
jgi:hypothetical protein